MPMKVHTRTGIEEAASSACKGALLRIHAATQLPGMVIYTVFRPSKEAKRLIDSVVECLDRQKERSQWPSFVIEASDGPKEATILKFAEE